MALLVALPSRPALPSQPAPPLQDVPAPPNRERVEVTLVLVDAVVRGRKGRPVPGLTAEDFRVFLDGEEVEPSGRASFEEWCPAPEAVPAGPPEDPSRPRESVTAGPDALPRHLVLYFDFSQLTFTGRASVLRGAMDFVSDGIPKSERVKIVTSLDGDVDLTGEFTRDAEVLRRDLQALLEDEDTIDLEVVDEMSELEDLLALRVEQSRRKLMARDLAHLERQKALRSLFALTHTIDSLSSIRGRKALVLFTDTFRSQPGSQYIEAVEGRALGLGTGIGQELTTLAGKANLANVSIYTIDAGGLQVEPRTVEWQHEKAPELAKAAMRRAGQSALALQTSLAVDTGGAFMRNTNDLSAIADRARQDLSCYYLLGVRFNSKGDGAKHRIQVKLSRRKGRTRRGLKVHSRPYFIDSAGE